MLGYVTIEKGELKVREYDVYQGYYCGICKSIGRRLGQIPRLALSYDAAFLAILIAGIYDCEEEIKQEHCIVHPVQKRPAAAGNAVIDYAADMMVLLAYHKFLDDWHDDRNPKALAGRLAFSRCYSEVGKKYPDICRKVETSLKRLSEYEKEKCSNIDRLCLEFGNILGVLFSGYVSDDEGAKRVQDVEMLKKVLVEFGRNLGAWIYAIDALDDFEEDSRNGSYNPFTYRKAGAEGADNLLYHYLAEMSKAYDLLDIKRNKGIIDNIVFMGLRRRTDVVLEKGKKVNEQSV